MTGFEEMTRAEELHSIFWDMYKDAHGFRPRGVDTSSWSEQDFENEFEYLSAVIAANKKQRDREQTEAAEKFEKRMASLIECGARDRETALRWMHEAAGTGGDNSYLEWTLGLRYGYL
jgi:hypothetical protein